MIVFRPLFTDIAWVPTAMSYTQSLKDTLPHSFGALREAVLPAASSWIEAVASTASQAWHTTSAVYDTLASVVKPMGDVIGTGLNYIDAMETYSREHHCAVMKKSFHEIAPFARMLAESKDDAGLVSLIKTGILVGKAAFGLIPDADYKLYSMDEGQWFNKSSIDSKVGVDRALQKMVGDSGPDVTESALKMMAFLVKDHLAEHRYDYHEPVMPQPRTYAQFTPQTDAFKEAFHHASEYVKLSASSMIHGDARPLTSDEFHAACVELVDGYEESFKINEQGFYSYHALEAFNAGLNGLVQGTCSALEMIGLVEITA